MAKDRTIQDLLDEMTPEQKDLQALIVGAALEDDDISGDDTIVSQYNALSDIQKHLVHFLVGNILAERELEHSDPLVDNFLAHYGVKGMRWGFRRSDASVGRSTARAKVRTGTGTMGDAHQAALKSTGHRAINALTGDKTFWKRMGVAAGITAGLIGVSLGVSSFPEGLLSAVGESVAGPGVAGSGVHVNKAGDIATNKQIGELMIQAVVIPTAYAGAAAATIGSVAGNTARAIRGNAKINASAAAFGKNLKDRQTTGTAQTRKLLTQHGALRKKDLKHDSMMVKNFLTHHAGTSLKLAQKDA